MNELENLVKRLEEGSISPTQLKALQDYYKPSSWVESNLHNPSNPSLPFSFEHRDYQREMIDVQPQLDHIDSDGKKIYKTRSKIYRCGRQLGKCGEGGLCIPQADGSVKTLKQMFDDQEGSVFVLDERDYTIKTTDKIQIFENGVKDIYKVKLRTGKELRITMNHPLRTLDSWKPLSDLEVGDQILCPIKINPIVDKEIGNDYETLNEFIYLDQIVSIEYSSTEMTYDLSVEEYHNFVAEGVFIHNSTLMAAELLYHLITKENQKIIYVSPRHDQCLTFFDIVDNLLKESPYKPVRYSKNPFIMSFSNGSSVRGFTAASTAEASSGARGTSGVTMIICDEIDYISEDFINKVILPMFRSKPDCMMLASSTPSGARKLFYKWCEDPSIVSGVHFHYPSMLNPLISKEEWDVVQRTNTVADWEHEYLAEFGEQLEGVFRNQDIDACTVDTEHPTLEEYYSSMIYNPNNAYIMGIDWNKTYGVCICVIERDAFTKKYKIVLNDIIEKSEFMLSESIDYIFRIHREKFPCQYIYIDKGYGEKQWEDMKMASMNDLSLGLQNRVIGVGFQDNCEYFDTNMRKLLVKPTKPFLVENTQLVLERHQLIISRLEDKDKRLIDQLSKYSYKRVDGKYPTFEGHHNDHLLDAMMLALMGFRMNYEMALVADSKPQVVHLVDPIQAIKTNEDTPRPNIYKQAIVPRFRRKFGHRVNF